jgi:hypothetical protein
MPLALPPRAAEVLSVQSAPESVGQSSSRKGAEGPRIVTQSISAVDRQREGSREEDAVAADCHRLGGFGPATQASGRERRRRRRKQGTGRASV